MNKQNLWMLIALVPTLFFMTGSAQAVYTEQAIDKGKVQIQEDKPGTVMGFKCRQHGKKPYIEGEVLVKFKKGITSLMVNQVAAGHSAVVVKNFKILSTKKSRQYVLIKSKTLSTIELIGRLKKDPSVEAVSPNYLRHIDNIPDDPFFGELWGLHNTGQTVNGITGTSDADIDAPEAWDTDTGSSSVVVASIDTGVDYTHEDLAANMWQNPGETPDNGIDDDVNGYIDDIYGIDVVNDDTDPMDDHDHGTHTSGTMAAVGNNAAGITGVGWNTRVMALKSLDSGGWGTDADAMVCMDYVVDMKVNHGVNVVAINASWGGAGYNPIFKDAIEVAGDAGIMLCAAAGNFENDNDIFPHYPSSYDLPNIISVAATDQDDILCGWSNYGLSSVDLGAPGENILSTLPGGGYIPGPGDIFFDDMESGAGNWTSEPAWAITDEDAYSPIHAWSDSPYGDYLNDTDASIYSNDIDLSGATGDVYLGFWAYIDLKDWYDYLYIEISGDGGATWTELDSLTEYIYWDVYSYPIDPSFRTDQFRVRFHLVTDEIVSYDGVYIDDVGIGIGTGSDNYDYWGGTSMATAHVTGAVALMAARYPGEDICHRIDRIFSGVDIKGYPVATGGRLNVNNSIDPSLVLNPFITDVIPATGVLPETHLEITGCGFGTTQGQVMFIDGNSTEATVLSWSDTLITAQVPSGTGKYVEVHRSDGTISNRKVLSSWEQKEVSLMGRDSAAAALYEGKIYLFGGYLFGGYLFGGWGAMDDAEVYDPATDMWSTRSGLAHMPTARAELAGACVEGEIYAIGGFDDFNWMTLDTVESYNPATNSWSTRAPMPEPLCFMKAVSLDGNIYVTGGLDDNDNVVNTLYEYDPATDSWATLTGMNTARFEHGAVALNGNIYVFGGDDGVDYISSGEVYDPGSDSWSPTIADMPVSLARMGAATDGTYIYAIGGTNGDWWEDQLPVVFRYDPVEDTWEDNFNTLYELITPKSCAPAVFVPNYGLYSVNGLTGWMSTDELEYLNIIGPTCGDCNGDGKCTIDEIMHCINQYLGPAPVGSCCDCDGDGDVGIGEIQQVINCFLEV